MLRRIRQTFSRALVVALVLMVAVGAALPAWARTIAGPEAHVCHCETRGGHAHCACPICFPELKDANDDLVTGVPAMSSRCGKDDPGFRTFACAGVPTSSFVLTAPLVRIERPLLPPMADTQWIGIPESPPPRSSLST
ncbi:MAG: hypothetical protein JST00_08535 [Deltaproteobacteria bacterium]|nr:hypothetical protein [Deltaproteobacteria bacterium]